MDHPGGHTTEEVEDEISNVTQPVFDVIPEDVKKPHVHDDMKESPVEKHGGQKREVLLETCEMSGNFRIGISEGYDSKKIKGIFQLGALSEFP
jgi:hypothetical protein